MKSIILFVCLFCACVCECVKSGFTLQTDRSDGVGTNEERHDYDRDARRKQEGGAMVVMLC